MRSLLTVVGVMGFGLLGGSVALAQTAAPGAPAPLAPQPPAVMAPAPAPAAPAVSTPAAMVPTAPLAPARVPAAPANAEYETGPDGKPLLDLDGSPMKKGVYLLGPDGLPLLDKDGKPKKKQDDMRTTLMGKPMEGDHTGAYIQCDACVLVSSGTAERGEKVLVELNKTGDLPKNLIRLKSREIDTLLRGNSWTSSIVRNEDGAKWDRLMAFDQDGRGRYLNFLHGTRDYSTLCEFSTEEDLLCLSCSGGPAQCSEIWHDPGSKDFYMGFDREKGRVELLDWIQKSRWDGNRFLAPN